MLQWLALVLVLAACGGDPALGTPSSTEPSLGPAGKTTVDPQSWLTVRPLRIPRSHLNAAAVDGAIYTIGGNEQRSLRGSAAVERYDPARADWQPAPSLPVGTDHAMVAVVGSDLFVFGGNFASPSAQGYRFNIASGQWSVRAGLPEARAAGGAAALGSHVYVLGGFGADRRLLSSAHAYDTSADRWEPIHELPTPREHLAVVAFRGAICALGGHFGAADRTGVVECYDPKARRWSSLPPLLKPASDFDAVTIDDEIWAVGDDVQVFDGNRWRLGPPLGTPRFGVAAAVLGRSLYVIGGSARTAAEPGLVERIDIH